MSIKVMTMVFDRYPEGGSERLLALALADHARDDGTRIWPSMAELARKTMQSTRTVQRQVRRMVEIGWLQVVAETNGRPGQTNEYRINPVWISGGVLGQTGDKVSPVDEAETGDSLSPVGGAESVDNVIHTGDTHDATGDTAVSQTGDTAMSPESSGTVINRITPLPPTEVGGCGQPRVQGIALPKLRTRKERAWRETRSGVEWMAGHMGLPPWDQAAFDRGQGEPFAAYKRRVFERVRAAGGEV